MSYVILRGLYLWKARFSYLASFKCILLPYFGKTRPLVPLQRVQSSEARSTTLAGYLVLNMDRENVSCHAFSAHGFLAPSPQTDRRIGFESDCMLGLQMLSNRPLGTHHCFAAWDCAGGPLAYDSQRTPYRAVMAERIWCMTRASGSRLSSGCTGMFAP